ncbi:MAG: hypothetical protein ACYCYA_11745 [Actinomycetes bacterium]
MSTVASATGHPGRGWQPLGHRASNARRLGLVAGSVLASTLLLAAPALAAPFPGGNGSSPSGLTKLQIIGIFGGIPVAMYLIITMLVYSPSWVRAARARSAADGSASPVWFGGPEVTTGSARDAIEAARPTQAGGGASARW